MAIGILTVKKSTGILLKTGLTGVAKSVDMRIIVLNESRTVGGTAVLTADRVHVELYVGKAESVEHRICKSDGSSIGSGAGGAKHLSTELNELAASACLGLLVTEAGHDIIILKRHGVGALAVLNKCAGNAGGTLGTERNASALITVCKGIHLLLHNVGRITNTANKKLGILEGGSSDLAVTVVLGLLTHNLFYVSPKGCLLGKYVKCTFNLLNHFIFSPKCNNHCIRSMQLFKVKFALGE